MTKPVHHVFVYGTLKRGHGNNALLHQATFVSPGRTTRSFQMRETAGFPVVIDWIEENRHPVEGEVYEVDDATLAELDALEGHPKWYRRQEVAVDLGDTGIQQVCWIYVGVSDAWAARIRDSLPIVPPTNNVYAWRAQ